MLGGTTITGVGPAGCLRSVLHRFRQFSVSLKRASGRASLWGEFMDRVVKLCAATNKNGKTCKRKAKFETIDGVFCGQHLMNYIRANQFRDDKKQMIYPITKGV